MLIIVRKINNVLLIFYFSLLIMRYDSAGHGNLAPW